MAIFPKPKVIKGQPEPLTTLGRVKKEMRVAANRWLEEHFHNKDKQIYQASEVERYVYEALDGFFKDAIFSVIGIDRSFGEFRAKYDSPLKTLIEQAAIHQAKLVFTKFIKAEEKDMVLPEKMKRGLLKNYREAFEEAIYKASYEAGQQKGAVEAEKAIKELLKGK
jgi:hypothetical protein